MSKSDRIHTELGANIRESCGVGIPQAPALNTGPITERFPGATRSKNAVEIPIELIDRDPNQPREEFDEEALGRLADSLRTKGQLQPVRVRRAEQGERYILIIGERRWRAAQLAGLPTLTCIVHEGVIDPQELLSLQLIENVLREDLRPVEQARTFRKLMEAHGWNASQLARELHLSPGAISQAMALLDLPASLQQRIEGGELVATVGYELSKLDDPARQAELAQRVITEKLTRDEVIKEVRAYRPARSGGKGKGRGAICKKVTKWTHKFDGIRVTVERGRGLDDAAITAALENALAKRRPEAGPDLTTPEGRVEAA